MKNLIAVLCLGLLAGCGSAASRIGGVRCEGCRAADGRCLAGDTVQACGEAGMTCSVCGVGQACSGGSCVTPSADGGAAGGTGDGGLEDCSEAAKLIYVVDQDRTLSSFDPKRLGTTTGPFVDLGTLSCPAMAGAEPFSMAVDRNAVAWVIYDSGELFTVNVRQQPLSCVKTTFAPQQGVAKFGMGFVSNAPGAREETLFISGSDFNSSLATTKFATLTTQPPYLVTLLGTMSGAPELTGTGDARLWAFSPNVTPPKVARLSKSTGLAEASFELPTLAGSPRAWAFAFWGGDFFVFLERSTDASTRVWRVNGTTGALTQAIADTGRAIVGAGVSTCAPIEIN